MMVQRGATHGTPGVVDSFEGPAVNLEIVIVTFGKKLMRRSERT